MAIGLAHIEIEPFVLIEIAVVVTGRRSP